VLFDLRRALQAGVGDFIDKPFVLTDVVTRVSSLLDSRKV
jgi:DNA-binding response OmpR family regulator